MLRDVSMVLFASATGMLRGVSMVIQPMDTGRFIPKYCKAASCSCVLDRGHTNSFFSLMLVLVIIGMMGQAQSCTHLDRIPVAEELELSPMAMNIYSLGTTMSLPSNIAHVDSGTTRHASGCRALFREHLIANRKPQLSVRVASGTRLLVEFIGVMQLHVQGVRPKGSTGTQETFPTTLGLAGALFVPGMPPSTTLISTKQLFKQERIKTYLNDALYLELPSGVRIGITDTDTSYLIPYETKATPQLHIKQGTPNAHVAALTELPIDLIHQR